ncbi:MAG: hypothetical protein WA125_10655 [Desulfosporosinus sp.]
MSAVNKALRNALGLVQGWTDVAVPRTRTGRSRLERWPWTAECPCSHGWREGTAAKDG